MRNLAAKLTGKPAASLPRTQEAVVQYIADNISSVKELTDALAKELAIRLTQELAEAIVQDVYKRQPPMRGGRPFTMFWGGECGKAD